MPAPPTESAILLLELGFYVHIHIALPYITRATITKLKLSEKMYVNPPFIVEG